MKDKTLSVLVAVLIVISSCSVWANEFGYICVAPVPEPNNGDITLANPMGGGREFNFSIQIDKGEIKEIPHKTNVQFTKLELETKHLVIIRNNREIIESFWFSFEDYGSNDLCLWFKSLYETWTLWPLKTSKHICKCDN